jgi:polysaccharide pyruvyl transferase WcaK-like protein
MRILVLHAWLKGNLGDVLQLSVLLSALRELKPRALDLAGFPARPAVETADVLRLADRYVPDPFPWYWKLVPALAEQLVLEPWWRRRRVALFSRYDALVCAPGPYLAAYDARAPSALCDITVATELGLPVVLSSHSVGPLQASGLAAVARATARIAREPATYHYLCERGMSTVLSADLAFLYPYAGMDAPGGIQPPYRALFLRSNNLDANRLRLEDGAVFEGSRLIAEAAGDRLVLATSDCRRDERFLAQAARNLGLSWVGCRSVKELVALIGASSGVVSDRYHPAICAAALGKPALVLSNREPHKMQGLKDLLADNTLEELQGLARAGLRTLRDALQGSKRAI